MEDLPLSHLYNRYNVTDVDQFNRALLTLARRLISTAASGNSLRKFATGTELIAGFRTLFGLVQCTPDLSKQQCDNCLAGAFREIAVCCGGGKQGAIILTPSCNIRFEVYPFFEVTPATLQSPTPPSPKVPSAPPPPPADGKKSNKARTTIIIVVPTGVVILIFCICIFLKIQKPKEAVQSK